MRITNVKIKNYRAFYGEYNISLTNKGKNLMVFGENGSGKSSFYHAMKTFFEASKKVVPMQDYENIFVPDSEKESAEIALKFKAANSTSEITEILDYATKQLQGGNIALVSAVDSIKGFLDYRSLLLTHLNHDDEVNIFKIFLEQILWETVNRFSERTFGEEWSELLSLVRRSVDGRRIQSVRIGQIITSFNDGMKLLLEEVERDTNTFLQEFIKNIKIKLHFSDIQHRALRDLDNQNIRLEVNFCDETLPKHQFFLNEARLSALAISLYLAAIKVNPTQGELKVLFLDDLLIGLDMSNRLPLLKIINEHFINCEDNFQIFMTTYDKIWFELVKSYFGTKDWEYIEMYPKKLKDEDFEIPVIIQNSDFIKKAEDYLEAKDYKASAVYIRTEFERLVKVISESLFLRVVYKTKTKELKSDDFWKSIKRDTNISEALVKKIEMHRGTVMNPFSHYDLEKPEFSGELKATIEAIKELKTLFSATDTDNTRVLVKEVSRIEALQREIGQLQSTIKTKDSTIAGMRTALSNRN
jgi:hypothetical protein